MTYLFDDRFIDVMPPRRHVLHEVLLDMAEGLREEASRQQRSPAMKFVGAWADLWMWPLRVRV